MMVDAWDVIWQQVPKYVLEQYGKLGHPAILFPAEANCFPFEFCDRHPTPPMDVKAKYINTGGVIGRAGNLAAFWADMQTRDVIHNDQGTIAADLCDGNPHNITLDYESAVFFSHFNAADNLHVTTQHDGQKIAQVLDNSVRNIPAVLHFNGLDGPGDDGKKQQVLSDMWQELSSDTVIAKLKQAKLEPLFTLGHGNKLHSWMEVCRNWDK